MYSTPHSAVKNTTNIILTNISPLQTSSQARISESQKQLGFLCRHEALRRKGRRFLVGATEEQVRRQSTDRRAGGHTVTAKTGDPEKVIDFWVPTDDEAPVRRQSTNSCPAFTDAHSRKRRHETADFFRQHFFHALFHRRIARRQLGLVTGAEQQTFAFRPKIDIIRDV